jgi:hypothetical protein
MGAIPEISRDFRSLIVMGGTQHEITLLTSFSVHNEYCEGK